MGGRGARDDVVELIIESLDTTDICSCLMIEILQDLEITTQIMIVMLLLYHVVQNYVL